MYDGKADQHMNQPDPVAAAPGAAVRPPSTADYIAFHAAQRPDAIAVIDGARRVTWDRFHNELRRVCGGPPVAAANSEQIQARIEAVRSLQA